MDISIIGYGVVGRAVYCGFEPKCRMHLYDPAYPPESGSEYLATLEEAWRAARFIFICVPTPCDDGGHFDSAIIDQTMATLARLATDDDDKIVIIKSTVLPNKVRQYVNDYPQLRIVVVPEYLVEALPPSQFLNQSFRIIGGAKEDAAAVDELFREHSACEPYEVGFCDAAGASLVKYATNTFLALKVSFMNQLHGLYEQLEVETDWNDLMRGLHLDARIGNSHYAVPGPDGKRGWGGRCFPKDLSALLQLAKELHCDLSVLQTAKDYNKTLRDDVK